MYSNNKLIRDVAEAAAKIMYGQKPVEEELKGNQKAIDKNHNGKVDGQDFAILRGEKKAIKEEDAYDKDRYAVKNGKAVKDNPAHMGSKDEPHHVWAKSADEALKKKMKEEVEQIDELKKSTLQSYYKKSVDRADDLGQKHKEAEINRMTGGKQDTPDEYKKRHVEIRKRERGQDNVEKRLGTRAVKKMDKEGGYERIGGYGSIKQNKSKFSEDVELEESLMGHVEVKPAKKSRDPDTLAHHDVHYKGNKIGHIEVYQHRTGMKYGDVHHATEIGTAGHRSMDAAIDSLRQSHAAHLRGEKKTMKKEEVELEEGIEDRLEAARAKAKAAGKPIKDKPTPPKSNVRKIEGSAYGGARQKDEPEEDDDDTPAKKTVKYGARQNYKRSTRVNESFTEMLTRYDQEGLKPFIESLSREEEEELIDDLSTEIADETLDVIDAGNYTEVTIGEEADTEEFTKDLETNKAKSSGKVKQPDLAKGDVMAVKNEEVELTERHMTDAEMQKRETIVKSMKKGLSGFKQRYGDRAKDVMYATATKQAMK